MTRLVGYPYPLINCTASIDRIWNIWISRWIRRQGRRIVRVVRIIRVIGKTGPAGELREPGTRPVGRPRRDGRVRRNRRRRHCRDNRRVRRNGRRVCRHGRRRRRDHPRPEIFLGVGRLLVIRRLAVLELGDGRTEEHLEHVEQIGVVLHGIDWLDGARFEVRFLCGVEARVSGGASRQILN